MLTVSYLQIPHTKIHNEIIEGVQNSLHFTIHLPTNLYYSRWFDLPRKLFDTYESFPNCFLPLFSNNFNYRKDRHTGKKWVRTFMVICKWILNISIWQTWLPSFLSDRKIFFFPNEIQWPIFLCLPIVVRVAFFFHP